MELKHGCICYTCDQCEYKAAMKINLERHIKENHEGVCYTSDQCEYRAKSKISPKLQVTRTIKNLLYM